MPSPRRPISASLLIAISFCWMHTLQAQTETAEQDTLEEVIVVSSRVEVPLRQVGTAVSVITAEEIQLRGYNTVSDVLRTQPGIGVTNTGGVGAPTALRIRGEEGYRTLVMLDGVKLADASSTQVRPTFEHMLTTNDIARMEVMRGPQGFIYGADAGGVVDIQTRTGTGPLAGELDVQGGSFNTRKLDATVSGGSEKGDFFVSATNLSTDGFNSRIDDTDLMDDDGYENTTFHTKLGWQPLEDVRIQFVARDVDAENEFDGCGFPTTNDCVGDVSQTTYKLSGSFGGDLFDHQLGIARTDVDRTNLQAGVLGFSTSGSIERFQYTGKFQATENTTLVFGTDMDREQILSSSGDDLSRNQVGYYLEYQGQFGDSFFLTAGLRQDDNDDFGEHTSARVSGAYLQTVGGGATVKYRASFGTGFRAPSLSEIAYNNGPFAFPPATDNPLSEETSEGYDIGVEYLGVNGLYLAATYFDQRIQDEIFFDLAGFSGYLQATGENLSKGVELAAEYAVSQHWTVMGNLTLNDTKDRNGDQRIRRPEQLGNIGFRYTSDGDRFRVLANYRISRDSVDEVFGVGRVPLDDYGVLDISGTFEINRTLQAFLRLENVTDESYQEVVGFRSAGFAAYAGIRARFQN